MRVGDSLEGIHTNSVASMATMANGFASLTSFGAAENVAGSKKKKNNKAKKAAEANGQPAAVQQPSLSSVTESVAALNVSTPANVVVEVTEAKAIYERAAREAKSLSDKAKLWKDWTRQVFWVSTQLRTRCNHLSQAWVYIGKMIGTMYL